MARDWTCVKWSEARQVTGLLDWRAQAGEPAGDSTPQRFFDALRAGGRRTDAVEFLSQALPRWEAVAWAARAVRDLMKPGRGADAEALKATLLWVQDPTEARRRAAQKAAESCAPQSAARLVALAAFYSGGSVAPPDVEPLPAPRDAAGKFAAGAILVASAGAKDMDEALEQCLSWGVAIACGDEGEAR